MNASVSVLKPFSSNGFAFRPETFFEPFSLPCERKSFSETVSPGVKTNDRSLDKRECEELEMALQHKSKMTRFNIRNCSVRLDLSNICNM